MLVQLVMAAMATAPSAGSVASGRPGRSGTSQSPASASTRLTRRQTILRPARPGEADADLRQVDLDRVGVARAQPRDRTIAPAASSRPRPGRFAPGCAQSRARYASVCSSTGKKPDEAPYSGAMLATTARSPAESEGTPGPKNSTNCPERPRRRSCSVTVSARSVDRLPSGEAAAEPYADHLRHAQHHRHAEHHALSFERRRRPRRARRCR